MEKTADSFKGYGVGDVFTLSDLQTQMEFDQPTTDFIVKETRVYRDPGDAFVFTGYVVESPNEQLFMLLVREMGTDFDLMLYYLDQDGDAGDMDVFIDEGGEDLCGSFNAEQDVEGKPQKVEFLKKGYGTRFGVEIESSESEEKTIRTMAEYLTEDDFGGNNHAFVEWAGDDDTGYVELWYGCEIASHEVEINSVDPD